MKWINVKDRLPVPEQRVFAYGQRCRDDSLPAKDAPFEIMEVDKYEDQHFWIGDWDDGPPTMRMGFKKYHMDGLMNVTHWIPVYEVVRGDLEPPEVPEPPEVTD